MLEILWWAGLAWFAAWAALPLVLVPLAGPAGVVAWVVLAPWSALIGMAGVHRLLPRSESGKFRLPAEPGSIRWALKGWAPSMYLSVFQPVFFTSEGFQRIVLRAFGARLGSGALLTSRTVVREPHRVRVGARSLVGEFAHLACSYQPRPGILVVGDIDIGDDVLIGAHGLLMPGVRIGSRCILEHAVVVGAHTTIGADTRIGEGTAIYNSVRIGSGARIGKRCLVASGMVIPDGTQIPDATVVQGDGGTVVQSRPPVPPSPRPALL